MNQWVPRSVQDNSGQDLSEYALLVGLIAVLVLLTLITFGMSINATFSDASAKVAGVTSPGDSGGDNGGDGAGSAGGGGIGNPAGGGSGPGGGGSGSGSGGSGSGGGGGQGGGTNQDGGTFKQP